MHAFLVDVRLDSADLVEEHAALAAVDKQVEVGDTLRKVLLDLLRDLLSLREQLLGVVLRDDRLEHLLADRAAATDHPEQPGHRLRPPARSRCGGGSFLCQVVL